MSRIFDGVDDRIGCASTGADLLNGGFTLLAVVKTAVDDSGLMFMGLRGGGGLKAAFATGGTGRLAIFSDTLDIRTPVGLTPGTWSIIRATKPPGSAQSIRFSCCAVGSTSWTHANSTDLCDDIAGVIDGVVFGASAPAGGGSYNGKLACGALAGVLNDTDVEAIGTYLSSQFLADIGSSHLWNLNQGSTGTAVLDLIGDADQNSINSTTVDTGDDPPGWDYDVVVVPPLTVSLRFSGGAANADPSASYGGTMSSVHATGLLLDDVSNDERTAGLTDYRLIYLANEDIDDGSVTVYVPTNLEVGRQVSIGVPPQAAGVVVPTPTNDRTAPSGVSFSAPSSAASGISLGTIPAGSWRGLWVRRTVASGTPIDPTNSAVITFEVARVA